MRILVVTNDFPPRIGGIQTYVREILARLDAEIVVMASSSIGASAFDAGFRHRVVRLPTSLLLPTHGVLARVSETVRHWRPDVVLFGAAMPLALMGPTLRRRHGVPYVAFTHGLEVAAARIPLGRGLLRRIGREAALVTAVSKFTRDILRPFVADDTRLALLPNGVDADRFHPGVDDALVRARHGLGAAPVVGCVARLVRRKGQDRVLRAIAALAPRMPSLRGLIVGGGPDESRLRRLAARLHLERRVVFAGEVAERDLPAYFRATTIFAMPCRSRLGGIEVEAFGGALLQASGVGRPVVAGRSGGTADAVIDNQTGTLVNGRDTADVTRAIAALLDAPEQAAAMGTRGAEWVRATLSWDQIATRCRSAVAAAIASS